jgi:hypothetical protein
MLLNEFLKEHKAFMEEHRTVEELKKQVAVVTAGLQRVSAQLEVSKSETETASNVSHNARTRARGIELSYRLVFRGDVCGVSNDRSNGFGPTWTV